MTGCVGGLTFGHRAEPMRGLGGAQTLGSHVHVAHAEQALADIATGRRDPVQLPE
jgi:hypothetical protein